MRETWTDDRLDDMSNRMDRDFDRVHADTDGLRTDLRAQGAELRAEMKAQGVELRDEIKAQGVELRDEMNDRFGEVNARFDRLEARFDSMQRMTLAAYISAVVGLIATQL